MDEKVFYQDDIVKITNLRLTCNHVTVPVQKIDQVRSNVRVDMLAVSFICVLLSFVPFYFYNIPPLIVVGIVLVIATSVWFVKVCNSYVELLVTIGPNKISILKGGMKDKEYIFSVSEEVARVIISDRNLGDKIKQMEQRVPAHITPSQTMVLRMAQGDIEKERKKVEAAEKQKAATENVESTEG